MGWFESFREGGGSTFYPSMRTSATVDVTLIIISVTCMVIASASFIIVVGARGRARCTTFLHMLFMLHAGIVIIVTLHGQSWLVANSKASLEYCEFHTPHDFMLNASLGINVGLKSLNVSLIGSIHINNKTGRIHYNERFWFIGASDLAHEFDHARQDGLPQPLLYALEFFSTDAGGLRLGRSLRNSGYFADNILWTAFATWILSNIIICSVVRRGVLLMILTGGLMVTTCTLYFIMQPSRFDIPYVETKIHMTLGWCCWLCLASGVITMGTGLLILAIHNVAPQRMDAVFLNDFTSKYVQEDPDIVVSGYMKEMDDFSFRKRPTYMSPRKSETSIDHDAEFSSPKESETYKQSVAEIETPKKSESSTGCENLGYELQE